MKNKDHGSVLRREPSLLRFRWYDKKVKNLVDLILTPATSVLGLRNNDVVLNAFKTAL